MKDIAQLENDNLKTCFKNLGELRRLEYNVAIIC
jgi:hypothetical protein